MTQWIIVIEIIGVPNWGKWTPGGRYAADFVENKEGEIVGYRAIDNEGQPGTLPKRYAKIVQPPSPLPVQRPGIPTIVPAGPAVRQ